MKRVKAIGLALAVVIGSACGGAGGLGAFNFLPDRTVIQPDGELVIFPGTRLTDPIVRVSGLSCVIVEEGTDGGLRVRVPTAVTTGTTVGRVYDGAIEMSRFDLEISNVDTESEIENNDTPDDATPVGGRRIVAGSLSTGDPDYFSFTSLAPDQPYLLRVIGVNVNEVEVDGELVTLDNFGEAEVIFGEETTIGIGGADGNYEIELVGLVR